MFRQAFKSSLLKGIRQRTSLGASTLLAPRFFSSRSVPQFRYQKPDASKEQLIKEKCFKHLKSEGQKKWPAICIAAKAGYPAIVKSLIDAGEDVNSTAHFGLHDMTSLQIAVAHKHLDVVCELIRADATASLDKKQKMQLLLAAVRNSDEKMVSLLSKFCINVNQTTDQHFTALDQAVLLNNPSMIRCLLSLCAHINGSRQDVNTALEDENTYLQRQSPLKRAVDHNHTEAAICLLQNGATIFDDDLSLLRKAVENNNEQLVRALVELGKSDPREAIDVARHLKYEAIELYLTDKIQEELAQATGCLRK